MIIKYQEIVPIIEATLKDSRTKVFISGSVIDVFKENLDRRGVSSNRLLPMFSPHFQVVSQWGDSQPQYRSLDRYLDEVHPMAQRIQELADDFVTYLQASGYARLPDSSIVMNLQTWRLKDNLSDALDEFLLARGEHTNMYDLLEAQNENSGVFPYGYWSMPDFRKVTFTRVSKNGDTDVHEEPKTSMLLAQALEMDFAQYEGNIALIGTRFRTLETALWHYAHKAMNF